MKTRRARRREHFARLLGPQPRRPLIPYHRRLQLEPLEHRHLLSGSPPVAVDDAFNVNEDSTIWLDTGLSLLADSGFNDAAGIHSDATPDSPYAFGETVHGRSDLEPGWGSTWVVSAGGSVGGQHRGKAEPEDPFEGDGVLRIAQSSSQDPTWVYRVWGQQQVYPFMIEQYLRLPANGSFGSRPGQGGIGPLIGPSWTANSDGTFSVGDGDGQGGVVHENTGLRWQPMQWTKVSTLVDPITQTFDFFVDGQRYNPPDPLNFRGSPTYIDRVDYLTSTLAWLDNVRILTLDTSGEVGLLQNDGDPDGEGLTALLVSGPSHGELRLWSNGSFMYAPSPGFVGTDSFTYKVSDGELESNIATVTIAVNGTPDAVDDGHVVDENTTLVVPVEEGVLANDSDPEGADLTAVLVDDVQHGTLDLAPDGSFTYTPATDFHGTDTFTYRATDGESESDPATVTITVDPVWEGVISGRVSNDADGNGIVDAGEPPLEGWTVFLDEDNNGLLDAGETSTTTNGSGEYQFVDLEPGDHTVAIEIIEGWAASLPASQLVTLAEDEIAGGIDFAAHERMAPTAGDDELAVDEDGTLSIEAPGVLANDSDPNSAVITAVLKTGPAHGTLELLPDGSLTYTPEADFFGTDTFTYVANDGFDDSNVATVTIAVDPLEDVPVAVDDAYAAAQGGSLAVAAAEEGVLANDTDADGDALTAVLVDGPGNGTVVLNGDGTFEYTPEATFSGEDSFTYKANDGDDDSNVATVTIAVAPDDTVPVGDLSYPADGAVIEEDLGYVDVRWTDPGSPTAGIDPATIDTGDITVQSGSRTLSVDRVEDQDNGVWRYVYADDADELVAGVATVTLVAGEVADRAGNVNVEATETFTFEPPPLAQVVWGEDAAGNPDQVTAIGGAPFSFTVRYTTNDDNPALTGLGLRMHFNSDAITFDGLSDVLAGLASDPQVMADSSDLDGDPATDTFVLVSWYDVGGNWPGGTLPADLFVANFTPSLTPDGTMTPVNFTRVSTAAGYGLDATPVTVTIQSGSLDVDANGEADALSDGILMLRYLFGFDGAALVQGALAPNAERTDPGAIAEFLNNCRDTMLDVDANGEADALTDGILTLRYLFGFTAGPLVQGALDPDAARTDPVEIIAFLDQFNPGLQGASPMAPLAAAETTGGADDTQQGVAAAAATYDPPVALRAPSTLLSRPELADAASGKFDRRAVSVDRVMATGGDFLGLRDPLVDDGPTAAFRRVKTSRPASDAAMEDLFAGLGV